MTVRWSSRCTDLPAYPLHEGGSCCVYHIISINVRLDAATRQEP